MERWLANLVLRSRISIRIQPIFDLLSFLLTPFTYLDHITSNRESLIWNSENFSENYVFEPIKTLTPVLVYVCPCLDSLDRYDRAFIRKMSARHELILLSNCSKHAVHSAGDQNPVFTRKNRGRDLAAYRDVAKILGSRGLERDVLFLNSSCYWDPNLLAKFIGCEISSDSISFMTSSSQSKFHFQTYFIYVPVHLFEAFTNGILNNFRNWRLKRTAVHFGELKSKEFLLYYGMKSNEIFKSEMINSSHVPSKYFNPSILGATSLIKLGAPFLKKTALLINKEDSSVFHSFISDLDK